MHISQTTTIKIDIDVHRAIEARRTDFGQSQNDILREEVFGMRPRQSEPTEAPALIPRTRRTGEYAFSLNGKRAEAGSLKDTYLGCLRALAELQPGFLEKLGMLSTRARRIVARETEGPIPQEARADGKVRCAALWRLVGGYQFVAPAM